MGKLSDWMRTPLKVEEDTYDREMATQDPSSYQGAVWPSAPLEPDVQQVDFRNPDPEGRSEVRLATGVLEFVDNLVEEFFDVPKEPKASGNGRGPVLDVQNRAATSWRGTTFTVSASGGIKVVTERDDRTRVVVTNWSTGIVYLGPATGAAAGTPNTIQLAAYDPAAPTSMNSREFFTADEIWAYPAVAGTPQIIDVQDEYGVPEWMSGGQRGSRTG